MSIILSKLGSHIGQFLHDRSYWAVKLRDGRWFSEIDTYPSIRPDHPYYDWSLDLTGTGDVRKIDELWLFCPKNWMSPGGNTARIKITEPGTAFQFQWGTMSMYGKGPSCQIIGQVTDKMTGDCRCFIWDGYEKVMVADWHTNINDFRTWHRDLAIKMGKPHIQHGPDTLGPLSKQVVGLD